MNPEESCKGNGSAAEEIPDTAATRLARTALQRAPKGSTAKQLDAIVRGTAAVTTSVREALVQEEIRRRALCGEDKAQPPVPGQDRESLQDWADAVREGKHPFMHVPVTSDFRPAGLDKANGFSMTVVKNGQDPSLYGRYYHRREIKSKDILAALEGSNPREALEALTADRVNPAELASHNRNASWQKVVLQFLTLLVVAAGIASWLYYSHGVKRRAAEAAKAAVEAKENQARSIVSEVKSSWNADDNWEDTLSSRSTASTPYTIELENGLIKGRPIIAFGIVDDVRKSGVQDNSIVLIQFIGRRSGMDLRFSLLSVPATTKVVLGLRDRAEGVLVFAATITSVEKVSTLPDENDNDHDYFVAHGILHEVRPTGISDPPSHK